MHIHLIPKNRLANLVSWLHLILSGIFLGAIAYMGLSGISFLQYWTAAAWLLISLLDKLDGALSRKYGKTPNGATLDERIDKVSNGLALILLAAFSQISWYFTVIMIARDIAATFIRNRAKKLPKSPVKAAAKPGKFKTVLQCITISAALLPDFPTKPLIVFLLLAASTVASLVSGMQILLLAANAKNPKWLAGTQGQITIPNWITIFRIALAPIIPAILLMQPFGSSSLIIGAVLALLTILTDTVDGILARKLHQKTDAGKMLDILADKIIFYFCLIGVFLASNQTLMIPIELSTVKNLATAALTSIVIHDAACVIGYVLIDKEVLNQFTVNFLNKTRFWVSCAWIIAVNLALASQNLALSWASFFLLIASAFLSWAGLISIIKRISKIAKDR